MIKLGFTGTRKGMTERQRQCLAYLLRDLRILELHHGDCVGADAQADEAARHVALMRVVHPPTDQKARAFCNVADDNRCTTRERRPYLERNRDIVDETDVLIAAPKGMREEPRSGTWATVRYARKLGKRIVILYP